MECISLKERFGRRFKVVYEESYHAERADFREAEAPSLMMIPCEHGHICPWGGEKLAACTRTAGPVAMRLRSLPFVEVVQDGADGVNAVFPADRFDEVAAVIKPKPGGCCPRRPGRRLPSGWCLTAFLPQ